MTSSPAGVESPATNPPVSTLDLVAMCGDVPIAVRVHRATDTGLSRQPAVLCTGSWLTVKEQMPDVYASALAARGYTAITFDFSGFGASGGTLRQTEVPVRKIADLAAVVDFVRTLSIVDPDRLGVLAICASAQYALAALGRGLPVAAFVSVAGWFHDTESVSPFYGGEAGVADRLERAAEAARVFSATGTPPLVRAYREGDQRAAMSIPMDYYADPHRGAVPTWRNDMTELSWAHWLLFDAFSTASRVSTPTLLVHSEQAVLPNNVRRLAELLPAATVEWTSGEQTDFYDQPEQVGKAVELAAAFLGDHLAPA